MVKRYIKKLVILWNILFSDRFVFFTVSNDGTHTRRISVGLSEHQFREVIKQVRNSILKKEKAAQLEELKKLPVKKGFRQQLEEGIREINRKKKNIKS